MTAELTLAATFIARYRAWFHALRAHLAAPADTDCADLGVETGIAP